MQAAKEKVSDVAASAKAGMEKTKAIMAEKAEKMTTRDPIKKEMATQKKEERIGEAERQKQMAYGENAAARHGTSWAGGPTAVGGPGPRSTTITSGTGVGGHGTNTTTAADAAGGAGVGHPLSTGGYGGATGGGTTTTDFPEGYSNSTAPSGGGIIGGGGGGHQPTAGVIEEYTTTTTTTSTGGYGGPTTGGATTIGSVLDEDEEEYAGGAGSLQNTSAPTAGRGSSTGSVF